MLFLDECGFFQKAVHNLFYVINLLGKQWIYNLVKQWNQSQNEKSVTQLHLIWFDDVTTNLSIHSCCLESPSRSLLVKKGPKHWQWKIQNQNSQKSFSIFNQFGVINATFGMIQPMFFLFSWFKFLWKCSLEKIVVIFSILNSSILNNNWSEF